VLVEHPFQPEWTLVQPEKPLERSRGVYRFAVPVAAGKSEKLPVVETRLVDSSVAVSNLQDDRIEIFIRSSVVSQPVKNALQKLLELKAQLGDTAAKRALAEARAADIGAEQGRIRSNMDRLSQSSDLYKKYVKTLSDQEEELAKLRDEIARLREQEAAQRKVIDAYISSIDVK
jgi:chromosome segregation ATPase